MKKKLYSRMTSISVAMMLLTMCITVVVFHGLFSEQVMEDLKTHVHILKSTEAVLEYVEKDFDPQIDNLRITVIDSDGKVIYDSNADIGTMENHGNRPEVHEALEKGSGEAKRKSSTLDKTTYYYAEKMSDGRVIRVAKEVLSIWQFCFNILPILMAEMLLTVVICLVASKLLAKRLVEPIEQMAQHLDDVSHELKTPLAAISGYAELIETGIAKEKDIKHFASEIHKSANRLLSLINDIIELSQLDVMDGNMEKAPVDLSDEAQNCVEMLQMHAEKHKITLLAKDIEKNCIIYGNQNMIQEILYNLCDNAIRYNKPKGHVWVSVFEKDSKIILRVKDDGIGIAPKEQERIFERFYRVDKARSKKTGGTGLGLAIVKHIAEQHSAEIVIKSEIGQGTVISIEFTKNEKDA